MFVYKAKRAIGLLESIVEDMQQADMKLEDRFEISNLALKLEKMVTAIEGRENEAN